MIDSHVHTMLCGHARGAMEDYIQMAIQKGLRQICFLEHVTPLDINHKASMAIEEIPLYFQAVQRFKHRYQNEINVRVGLEIDFQPDFIDLYHHITQTHAFDVIGSSIHTIEGIDVVSPHTDWASGRLDVDAVYATYLQQLDRMVEHTYFDVVCHIDLIKKYGHRGSRLHLEKMKQILSKISEKGMAVELNTSGWEHPIAEPYPAPELVADCRQKNIRMTLSSDAHDPKQVGRHFEQAVGVLIETGYDHVVTYERRQPIEVPINGHPIHTTKRMQI